jgi:dephospho-CoA kinase
MVIGITGTNGAGKGTVVDYLVQRKGFTHYSVRQFLIEEIERRGLPINRDNTRLVANELRKAHGPGYIAEQLFAKASQHQTSSVIESIRSLGEANFLRQHAALLWAIDADREIRFKRTQLRGSETDKVTFEQFCEQEDREMNSNEPWDMNVFGVIKMADHVFHNEGTPEELFVQVEETLKETGIE